MESNSVAIIAKAGAVSILTISVSLHVRCSSLDVWRCIIGFRGSQNFIADKEPAKIVVLVEDIHYSLESLELGRVPLRLSHTWSIYGGVESVQVEPDVDTSVGEGLHAGVVVGFWVNVVNADGVGAQGLHQVGIEGALGVVDERIIWQELVGNTLRRKSVDMVAGTGSMIQHTLEKELVAITGEELGAFGGNSGNGVRDAGQKAQDGKEQHICREAHGRGRARILRESVTIWGWTVRAKRKKRCGRELRCVWDLKQEVGSR
jgi:hypothetical protein